ncbi:uncharacterized protein Dyak_GE27509 [Drosophila yakuba]|uniref:Uncharacterized protein n=1 Tax=Drosophila yakuba TaxID=7245 RepID=A0A0R1E1B6_DROYA|nr:uncharacterized protein Dyak_GE27509 [Drosophila yakuba]
MTFSMEMPPERMNATNYRYFRQQNFVPDIFCRLVNTPPQAIGDDASFKSGYRLPGDYFERLM